MIWVFVIVCILIWLALIFLDNDDDRGFYNFLIFVFALFALMIGSLISEEIGIRSNKPIKPSIKIECTDGKCDTTYIYKNVKK